MSTRNAHAYQGPADLWLTFGAGDQRRDEHYPGAWIHLEQTMPDLFQVGGLANELPGLERVRLVLPDGRAHGGPVTWARNGVAIFQDDAA